MERVALLGAVEHDVPHPAALLGEDEGHGAAGYLPLVAGTPTRMSTTEARRPRGYEAMEALANVEALDAAGEAISKWVRGAIPHGPVKDAISGSWLGHALHPLLTDVPIGLWTSAVALDWVGGRSSESAADRLVGLGIGATLPAIVSGASDWGDSTVGSAAVQRIGLVHAVANVTATTLFGASLAARRSGARGRGKLLALAGTGVLSASAYLGGHLSFAQGIGVDRTAFDEPGDAWTDVLADAELTEGQPRVADAGGIPVLLVRDGGEVLALSDRCVHRGGPLHEGTVEDGCVTCPWHGSRFQLRDGTLERGPAAYPQPAWEARVQDGRIAVRPRTE
jgi:nitrite reductase/ring-hydroxylating ferredoxin subunit/uncharacterized membrane protein